MNPHSLPFWLIHVLALVLPFFVAFSWKGLAISATVYFFGMFFVTGGYHRYFSHRAYKTSRPFQFLLALGAQITCQKGRPLVGFVPPRPSSLFGHARGPALRRTEWLLVVAHGLVPVQHPSRRRRKADGRLHPATRSCAFSTFQASTFCRRLPSEQVPISSRARGVSCTPQRFLPFYFGTARSRLIRSPT